MDVVKLNFVNRSHDRNNTQIVIFQKNSAEGFNKSAVAWKVIKGCEPGQNLLFDFPLESFLQVKCESGNSTPIIKMPYGKVIEVIEDELVGIRLQVVRGVEVSDKELFVKNSLEDETAEVRVYKDNKLLSVIKDLPVGITGKFLMKETSLWVGAITEMVEGEVMVPAAVASIDAVEFSLAHVVSADIVMVGGGPSNPFSFKLENVVKV